MEIITLYPLGYASNSYLLVNEAKEAVMIDCPDDRAVKCAVEKGYTIKFVLLTHGHFDHIGGVALAKSLGAKVGCLDSEVATVLGKNNLASYVGVKIPPFTVDFTLCDGEEISLLGCDIRIIATPGHTSGSACFLVKDALFTGDTLFCESVGRTDFPTGDGVQLRQSLKKIDALADDVKIYPGHGEETTLEYERKINPYLIQALC